jgi:hypothetical protein
MVESEKVHTLVTSVFASKEVQGKTYESQLTRPTLLCIIHIICTPVRAVISAALTFLRSPSLLTTPWPQKFPYKHEFDSGVLTH